jgi:hypothetical protein
MDAEYEELAPMEVKEYRMSQLKMMNNLISSIAASLDKPVDFAAFAKVDSSLNAMFELEKFKRRNKRLMERALKARDLAVAYKDQPIVTSTFICPDPDGSSMSLDAVCKINETFESLFKAAPRRIADFRSNKRLCAPAGNDRT